MWREYRAISEFYGERRAKRSDVPLMHHIDEGLAILDALGATERAKRAYCLHAMVRADADLGLTYEKGLGTISDDPVVIALAFEYRNIANTTLSDRVIVKPEDIPLSPIAEVNDMLRADKVQNWKDFVLHHLGSHPHSAELERYFRMWHARLGLSEERVRELVNRADQRPK